MEVGGGEAAEQVVRMMLSGGEVAVRLGASAVKNMLALSLALAKSHKKLYGKVNMTRMLRETRDIRQFAMTPEEYQQFKVRAKKQKILFSAVKDADGHGKLIDVLLPVTELNRANPIFERIQYAPKGQDKQDKKEEHPEPAQEKAPKKESRSGRDSHDTRDSSSIPRSGEAERTTSERPSVEQKLQSYREQQQRQAQPAPAKAKTKKQTKTR